MATIVDEEAAYFGSIDALVQQQQTQQQHSAEETTAAAAGDDGAANATVYNGGAGAYSHAAATAILAEKQRQLVLDDEALQRERAALVHAERLAMEQRRRALAAKAAEEEALVAAMASRRRMEEERLAMDQRALELRAAALSDLAAGARQRRADSAVGDDSTLRGAEDKDGDGDDDDDGDITAAALKRVAAERERFAEQQKALQRRADVARARALNYSDAVAASLRGAVESQEAERRRKRAEKDAAAAEERERLEVAMAQRLEKAEEAYLTSTALVTTTTAGEGGGSAAAANATAPTKPARYPKAVAIPFSGSHKFIGDCLLNPQQYQARALLDAEGLGGDALALGRKPAGLNATHHNNNNANASTVSAAQPYDTAAAFGVGRRVRDANMSGFLGASQQQQQQHGGGGGGEGGNNTNAVLARFLATTDAHISGSSSRAVLAAAGAMGNAKGGLVATSPAKGPAAPFTAPNITASSSSSQQRREKESLHYARDGRGVMYYNAAAEGVNDVRILDSYAKAAAKEAANKGSGSSGDGEGNANVDGEGASADATNPFRVLEALSFYEGEWEGDQPHGTGTLSAPSAAYSGAFSKGRAEGRGTLQTRRLYASMDFKDGAAKGAAVVETSAGETFAGVVDGNAIASPGSLTLAQVAAPTASQQQQQQSGHGGNAQSLVPSGADTMEWVWEGTPDAEGRTTGGGGSGGRKGGATPGSGQARIRYANGDLYVGPVADYKPHGPDGCYRFRDGTTYSGSFEGGTIAGRGTYRFESGNVYEGDVRGGLFHGQGTYTRVGEFTYAGAWAEGRMHGQARVTFSNGDVWEGTFVRDAKGQGRYVKSAQFLLAPVHD